MHSQLLFIEEAKYTIPVFKTAAHKPQLMFLCVKKVIYYVFFKAEENV